MKRKNIILFLLLTATMMLNAQIIHHGFVRTYLGALTDQNGEYSVLQNTFDWRINYGEGDVELYINPVFAYNALNDELDISLRQAYMDIYFDNFDLRSSKDDIRDRNCV